MNTTRYVVALFAVVVCPAALMFWPLIHPFVGRWRRIGTAWTYTITLLMITGIGAFTYAWRGMLLSVEYGWSERRAAVAILLLAIGLTIQAVCRRSLSARILIGLPELVADRRGDRLLQEGIYAKIRHPRYVGAAFGIVAVALFANYLATYVLAVAFFPLIYLVTVLEERELVDRFGEAYRAYQRRVPRFIPRLSHAAR
jgi:protein-S-isoprenylcysteine O-methyltransferase Ste14